MNLEFSFINKKKFVLSTIIVAFLLLTLSVVGLSLSGFNEETTVEVTNTTIEPGEQSVVTIVAENVGEITPLNQKSGGVVLRTDKATFDVPPHHIQQSDPPNWVWDEPKDPLNNPAEKVSVRIPVESSRSAKPGKYTFGFSIKRSSGDERGRTFFLSVTISERD